MVPLLPIIGLIALLGISSSPSGPKDNTARISRADLQAVQYDLQYLGYLHLGYQLTGTYDDATHMAIRSFQDDHGIKPADGWPTKATRDTLDAVIAMQP
jgi:peptidoglycan hydrolase-like protein with peptidoglycan-binding domain